jgi:hypothetical protein
VHVLRKLDAILAPWNARRFPYSSAIAWHFHGLRILANNQYLLHSKYQIPDTVDKYIYLQYVEILSNIKMELPFPVEQGTQPGRFKRAIKGLRDAGLNIKKVYLSNAKIISH